MIISNNIVNKENNIYEIEELLFKEISKTNLGSVTDVSDQFVMVNLNGEKIYDLLSTGCPFDFSNFKLKEGSVVQTLLDSNRCNNSPQKCKFY